MRQIKELHTWVLIQKLAEANVVGCKWVYKLKRDMNGAITRYKVRLVAQGFTQVPGIDYIDTFAPVAKFSTLRILLVLAAHYDWEVHQMEMKNANLNGELTKTIYMCEPPGFINSINPKHMCRLVCSLYGLRQSRCVWYQTLVHTFKDLGFTVCAVDHTVFVLCDKGENVIIAVSMDDLLMLSKSLERLTGVKCGLEKHFEMTDLGKVHWLLGVEIWHN